MAAQEKHDGHRAEKDSSLHKLLTKQFKLDTVSAQGSTGTKTDILGVSNGKDIRFSLKFASLANTQVWLPTLRSLVSHLPALKNYEAELDSFLGTTDSVLFESRRVGLQLTPYEVKKKRIYSDKINNWKDVIGAFNAVTKDKSILKNMLLAKGDEANVNYLIWINKKAKGIQIIDAQAYVEYISVNAEWCNPDKGFTTLWCKDKNTGKKLFHLQRKGSGGEQMSCAPMFHLYKNWPDSVVVYRDDNFTFV